MTVSIKAVLSAVDGARPRSSILCGAGRRRKARRRIAGIGGAAGRDGCHDRAVNQHLDLLRPRLVIGALRGLERDLVAARGKLHRLADAAAVLDPGHLRAVRGIGIAGGEGALVAARAGHPRELPGANRTATTATCRPSARGLEAAVGDRVRGSEGDRHRVDKGRAVGG